MDEITFDEQIDRLSDIFLEIYHHLHLFYLDEEESSKTTIMLMLLDLELEPLALEAIDSLISNGTLDTAQDFFGGMHEQILLVIANLEE